MSKVFIYTLRCPFTEEIKYVGQTMYSLEVRLKAHINTPVNKAMKEWLYTLDNTPPIIEEVDFVDTEDACFFEMYWIQQFRQWNYKLLNKAIPYSQKRRYKKILPILIQSEINQKTMEEMIHNLNIADRNDLIAQALEAIRNYDDALNTANNMREIALSFVDELINYDGIGNGDNTARFYMDGFYTEFSKVMSDKPIETIFVKCVKATDVSLANSPCDN